MVPDLGYDDLEITDGQESSLAYAEMIDPATPDGAGPQGGRALLPYNVD